MTTPLRVLVVEDSVDDTFFVIRHLQRGGFHVDFERVDTAADLVAALQSEHWDLIICDDAMPQFNSVAALALYQESGLDIPFVVVSGGMGEERVIEILRAGAHDFVLKSNLGRLVPAVTRELQAAADRRIRQQTREAANFLASLVESCDDAIVGETLDGVVVSWNVGAEKLYGYTAGEMLGRSVTALIPHYRPEELTDLMGRIRGGDHIERFETVRVRKDGVPIEVSLTISPVKDASGRVIGASAVARDITQRKQEENERLALIRDLTAALSHAR